MERLERRGRLRGRHLVVDAGRDNPRDPVGWRSLTRRPDRGEKEKFFLLRTLSAPRAKDPISAGG